MTDAAVPALSEAAAALDRWQARGRLPRLDELPIPADVRPGPGWTQQMTEMADHIGAYTTLCIVARYGGTQVYIGRDPARSPFAEVVDAATAAAIADIYGGNRLLVPVGRVAIARAAGCRPRCGTCQADQRGGRGQGAGHEPHVSKSPPQRDGRGMRHGAGRGGITLSPAGRPLRIADRSSLRSPRLRLIHFASGRARHGPAGLPRQAAPLACRDQAAPPPDMHQSECAVSLLAHRNT